MFLGILLFLTEIFQIIQWVKVPPGASGSSIITAMLSPSERILLIVSGGEMSCPSAVYFLGIISPSLKALEVIFKSLFIFMHLLKLLTFHYFFKGFPNSKDRNFFGRYSNFFTSRWIFTFACTSIPNIK